MRQRIRNVAIFVAFALASCASAAAQERCEDLKNLHLDRTAILSATAVEASVAKQPPVGTSSKEVEIPIARHCEVTGVARPTADSEINFTVWMPPKDAWNGKYVQVGSGGFGGFIFPAAMAGHLASGYAVSATDDGHRSQSLIPPDSSFAVGHPEKLIDFGYRAVHETSVLSKVIVEAFYGQAPGHAYFSGCSNGGRQALMEAERYPEDFDGILAGAPANHWTHHFTAMVWNELAMNGTPESKIKLEQLPMIQKAALDACDALDGVKDGIIGDPRKCHFDPSVLQCHNAVTADCLTKPQIDSLKKIYAGPTNPRTGEQIYPGFEPGTEADPAGWSFWILGGLQAAFGNSFYSQAVFEGDSWDWRTMNFDRDLRIADEKTGAILNAYDPDLRSFRDHGGKLIEYQGWADSAIAPRDAANFYDAVDSFLQRYPDPRWVGSSKPEAFYRLFMVPGMQHCAGGSGATSFGNAGPPMGLSDDADHDVFLALDRWVTKGVAPDKIIASGVPVGSAVTDTKGSRMTRPLCAYPATARYEGQGDPNVADNFECVLGSATKTAP